MNRYLLGWIILSVMIAPAAVCAGSPPAPGEPVPKIRLPIPSDPRHQAYLGFDGPGEFELTDISGRLLIVEIFSMYCPHCQREAGAVNRLYEAIEASQQLRGQVKMIGIGVGNSSYEVDHFRKHYSILFPLFADADFVVHQKLGEVRTPFFLIVDIGPADKGRILWTGAGKLDTLESFMSRLSEFLQEG